jgi:cytochrome c551/c552
LIEGADCLACHKIDAKLIGPSYQDVAAKYTKKILISWLRKSLTEEKATGAIFR